MSITVVLVVEEYCRQIETEVDLDEVRQYVPTLVYSAYHLPDACIGQKRPTTMAHDVHGQTHKQYPGPLLPLAMDAFHESSLDVAKHKAKGGRRAPPMGARRLDVPDLVDGKTGFPDATPPSDEVPLSGYTNLVTDRKKNHKQQRDLGRYREGRN